MGKTHFSGLAVGDTGSGIYGGAMLCQSYRFETPGDIKLNFNEPTLLRDAVITNDAGVSIAGTIKLGTTSGGVDIFPATALTAGTPGLILKKVSGTVWLNSSVALGTVWLTYATSGT